MYLRNWQGSYVPIIEYVIVTKVQIYSENSALLPTMSSSCEKRYQAFPTFTITMFAFWSGGAWE